MSQVGTDFGAESTFPFSLGGMDPANPFVMWSQANTSQAPAEKQEVNAIPLVVYAHSNLVLTATVLALV